MKSIRDLYKIGKGPSSSHTMGPARAAEIFKSENPDAERYEVVLYGSLAKTGIGHGTDRVLRDVFAPKDVQIVFAEHDPDDLKHPNTLDLSAFTRCGKNRLHPRDESIGGGDIVVEGRPGLEPPEVYPENSFAEIARVLRMRGKSALPRVCGDESRARRSGTFSRIPGTPCGRQHPRAVSAPRASCPAG